MTALNVDTYWLHEAIMLLVIVLFVGVFGFMFWSCYAHRKAVGRQAEQFHKNIMVEILWTVIPAIIMAVIAWPVTKMVIAQNDGAKAVLRPHAAMQPFKQIDIAYRILSKKPGPLLWS